MGLVAGEGPPWEGEEPDSEPEMDMEEGEELPVDFQEELPLVVPFDIHFSLPKEGEERLEIDLVPNMSESFLHVGITDRFPCPTRFISKW